MLSEEYSPQFILYLIEGLRVKSQTGKGALGILFVGLSEVEWEKYISDSFSEI